MANETCNCTFCTGLSGNNAFFSDSTEALAEDDTGSVALAPKFKIYSGARGYLIKHQVVSTNPTGVQQSTTTSMGMAWLTNEEADNLQVIAAHLLASRSYGGGSGSMTRH